MDCISVNNRIDSNVCSYYNCVGGQRDRGRKRHSLFEVDEQKIL
nr:MAG TPA_asm: hypothetical protein [Caudoviricetes sp.]